MLVDLVQVNLLFALRCGLGRGRIRSTGIIVRMLNERKKESVDLVTLQCLETLSRLYVPDFDGGVGVPRHQDVVFELHAAGEGLMTRERVYAVPRLDVPHADGRV